MRKSKHTLIRIPEGNNSENEIEAIFEEITIENFLERHQLRYKRDKNKFISRHVIMKL